MREMEHVLVIVGCYVKASRSRQLWEKPEIRKLENEGNDEN